MIRTSFSEEWEGVPSRLEAGSRVRGLPASATEADDIFAPPLRPSRLVTREKWIGMHEQPRRQFRGNCGTSLIEITVVVVMAMILAAISVPVIWSTVYSHRLRSAVASATWAIQATRYEAMMKGYPYALTFDPATVTYQVSSKPPGAPAFSNVRNPVPLSGAPVTINATTTLEFRPNGMVQATTGQLTFSITYYGSTKTVTVSRYGNVTATP